MKKLISYKEAAITTITFVSIFILSFVPLDCKYLNPISNALGDFDIFDVVTSKLLEEQPADTNIVLVNAADFNREEIASILSYINQYEPRVIGVDIFFNEKKDPDTDQVLANALASENIVLVSRLDEYDEKSKTYKALKFSDSMFINNNHNGYANLPEDDGFRTIRDFRPFVRMGSVNVPAFSSKILSLYDESAYQDLLKRKHSLEKINYRGNYNSFYFLDSDVFQGTPPDLSFIKGKIVLFGYMGPNIHTKSLEDIFFTPLNPNYAGKTFPDMYGIVIHANIISMALHRNYISAMPWWLGFILSIFIALGNIKLMLKIKSSEKKEWFGFLTKFTVFMVTTLNLFLSLMIYYYFSYRINLTLALLAVVLSNSAIEFYENYVNILFKHSKKLAQENKLKLKFRRIFSQP